MQRVCFLLKVRREKLDEYKKWHRAVWPEMQAALHETGWNNYSLFLTDEGLLIGYFETPDFKAALEGMERQEVNKRWQREMVPFFEALEGKRPDENISSVEEIFHME